MNYKRKTILMVMAMLCLSLTIMAQPILLKLSEITVKQAMDELKNTSEYSFVFTSGDIDSQKIISVDAKQLKDAVEQILVGQTVNYEIKGKNVIIKKAQQVPNRNAEARRISGSITDQSGEPVIGASVIVGSDQTRGFVTGIDGTFSLEVSDNESIVVSYLGYVKQTIAVKGKSEFAISLVEDSQLLDEVIVIGYVAQKKGLLTGAVSSMKVSESLANLPLTSAGNLMIGKMAGVNVSTADGVPGAQPGISIRTNSTFGKDSGGNNIVQRVTYVIDGVIRGGGDFNNLSPNEIEDITILKDAASAAIYGSRAAGGVILVTTKRGKLGKPVFNYSYSYAVDSRTKNMSLTSAVETGSWYNKINETGDPASWRWSQEELDHYATINNGWGYDQLDAVWRDPSTQSHNFSVTGGAEKVKYFAGLSYVDQKAFLEPLTYKKMNFRLNVTVQLSKDLEFFAGMGLTDNNTSELPWEDAQGQYAKLLVWQPDQPVYTDGGQLVDYGWIANVGAETSGAGGYVKKNFLKPQMVFNLKYNLPFIEGLSAKAAFSSNWSNNRTSKFQKNYDMAVLKRSGTYLRIIDTNDDTITGWRKSNKGKDHLRKDASWGYDHQVNLQLDYNRTFNDLHSVQGALVYERSGASGAGVWGSRETFPVYLTDQFWAASTARNDTNGNGGKDWKDGRVSFIGQFNYSYANKYLASFSFREDGSMQFHEDQRWGFFPAGSLGWIISEESFFNKSAISHLKLSASVGLTGDDQVGGWQWQESYKPDKSAYFGISPKEYKGITYGAIVNQNLTWEKSLSYNVRADVHFLKNWNATLDYWYKNTYDILGSRGASVPTSFPLTMPDENYGKMRAQGVDFELGYRNNFSDFNFNANLTMSYGWNKIIQKDHAEKAKWASVEQGKSSTYQKGYWVHSILRTQEQLDAFKKEYPNYKISGLSPDLGMLVYKDISGPDGKPDGTIDVWDEDVIIKNNHPIYYGLNLVGSWKGIGIDMMFNGQLGAKKSFKDAAGGVEWNRGWKEWYDNAWSAENPNGWMPERISANSTRSYEQNTNFWWKDSNFLRLKYVTLSYIIPKHFTGNALDQLKIFVTGTNLFNLSSFNYWDPEVGGGRNYPVMRTFNFGASVTF